MKLRNPNLKIYIKHKNTRIKNEKAKIIKIRKLSIRKPKNEETKYFNVKTHE